MTNTFEPEGIIKRVKGKMVMLYALVDGEEVHMASFFHEEKCDYVIEAIKAYDDALDIEDESAPKRKSKKAAPKKTAKTVAKKGSMKRKARK